MAGARHRTGDHRPYWRGLVSCYGTGSVDYGLERIVIGSAGPIWRGMDQDGRFRMPRPYSADLRERVIMDCEAGVSCTEVARRYRIGERNRVPMGADRPRWRADGTRSRTLVGGGG